MDVKLYKTNSKSITLDKVLTDEIVYTDTIFYDESALNLSEPNVVIQGIASPDVVSCFNYMYIPQLKRYYYITNIDYLRGHRVAIKGRVDVLKTYAADIKNSTQLVVRQEHKKNMLLNDGTYPIKKKTQIVVENFGESFTENNNFILTTVGGGTSGN